MATGPANLVVIDIDAHSDRPPLPDRLLPGKALPEGVRPEKVTTGYDTLALLARLHGAPNPATDDSTLRVRTPSGGMHVWYRVTNSAKWLSSAGSSPGRALAWQVDVRARGGYIIAPGVRTAAGVYTPIGPVRKPTLLPDWLAHELARTGHRDIPALATPRRLTRRSAQNRGRHSMAERVFAAVLDEVEACAAVSEGAGFSTRLNKAAFTAGGLIAGGFLDAEEAEQTLLQTAYRVRPGQERRSEGIVRAGITAGLRRPFR